MGGDPGPSLPHAALERIALVERIATFNNQLFGLQLV
jgi:hypothetical protein